LRRSRYDFRKSSIAHRRWGETLGARASLFTDPDTKDEMAKQINVAVARMRAYDNLPPEVREGVRCALQEVDVRNVERLLKEGWSAEEAVRQLSLIRAPDILLNVGKIGTETNRARKRS
jgi:hypothetical protein